MGSPYAAEILREDGTIFLAGEVAFTDEGNQPVPPGGPDFAGWTSDDADPANVNANGGGLSVGPLIADTTQTFLLTFGFTGALPTFAIVSGTPLVVDAGASTPIFVPVTYDNSSADATLKIELSPDGTTYSTMGTQTWKTFTGAVAGNIDVVSIWVPAGWHLKLTAVHATLGTATQLFSSTA